MTQTNKTKGKLASFLGWLFGAKSSKHESPEEVLDNITMNETMATEREKRLFFSPAEPCDTATFVCQMPVRWTAQQIAEINRRIENHGKQ